MSGKCDLCCDGCWEYTDNYNDHKCKEQNFKTYITALLDQTVEEMVDLGMEREHFILCIRKWIQNKENKE